MDKAARDNHSNQCNPNNANYQGYNSAYQGTGTRADLNNHGNQMNPNNSAYSSSRGGHSGSSYSSSTRGFGKK